MVVVCGQRWRRSLDTLVRRPHCAIPVRKLPERLLHALRSFLPSSNNVACVRPGLQHAGLRRQAHAHQFLARTVNGKSTSLHSSGFLLLQQACRQQLITVSWLPLAVPGPLIPPTTLQTRNTPSYRYQLPNRTRTFAALSPRTGRCVDHPEPLVVRLTVNDYSPEISSTGRIVARDFPPFHSLSDGQGVFIHRRTRVRTQCSQPGEVRPGDPACLPTSTMHRRSASSRTEPSPVTSSSLYWRCSA